MPDADAAHKGAGATAPAPGFDAVLVPGEPEERTSSARGDAGIPLAEATLAELRTLGADAGVPFPEDRA